MTYLLFACEEEQYVAWIHVHEGPGDILLFLTGEEQVEATCASVRNYCAELATLDVYPLYASLAQEEQDRATVARADDAPRRLVVATNVAETSVTIDGTIFVVDAGLAKVRVADPLSGGSSLAISHISRAAATQRAGRAGRTRPGKCFRLYTADAFQNSFPGSAPPGNHARRSCPGPHWTPVHGALRLHGPSGAGSVG